MSGKVIALALVILAGTLAAQSKGGQSKYTPPRTADGQPDLQGVWTNVTITPLERPANLAGKEFFTPAEARQYEKDTIDRNNADRRDGGAQADLNRAYNDAWYDRGTKVVETLRTSLVIDPPDGRIPRKDQGAPLVPAGFGRPPEGPEDRSLPERCILWPTAGPPMMPSFYNNNYQIVQAPGYVLILVEMIHDARIIPIDSRPHVDSKIRAWLGDSRGHWEGNTLVVETTNFNGLVGHTSAGVPGSPGPLQPETPNMKITERFTRVAPDTIEFTMKVEDPTVLATGSYTVAYPMYLDNKYEMYEYACHEGNTAVRNYIETSRFERTHPKPAPAK
jgi:hypothetical protein